MECPPTNPTIEAMIVEDSALLPSECSLVRPCGSGTPRGLSARRNGAPDRRRPLGRPWCGVRRVLPSAPSFRRHGAHRRSSRCQRASARSPRRSAGPCRGATEPGDDIERALGARVRCVRSGLVFADRRPVARRVSGGATHRHRWPSATTAPSASSVLTTPFTLTGRDTSPAFSSPAALGSIVVSTGIASLRPG
jgi:hypothetical protein